LHVKANYLGALGHLEEAMEIKQRLMRMEPFVTVFRGGTNDLLWSAGQPMTQSQR
jgi:hypothetical protein